MKKINIYYWTATIIIFIMEGILPALTGNTELAKEGIRHLGFPDYFRIELTIFKVIGAIILILPMVPARVKEWAYAGFAITMISAFVGHWVIDGMNFQTFMPLIFLAILIVSYVYYHKKMGLQLSKK
ncbi:DoxX family protein [soil metagenome]